jgi:chemotaxis protein CheZ
MSSSNIKLEDAQDYLNRVIATLRSENRPDRDLLASVLAHIASYIETTRREITSLRANDGHKDVFETASDELEEVVTEAARATNEILSAAESIERLDPKTPVGDTPVNAAVTRIYEACAFQDITGQRIAKVIRTLKEIETRVTALATACGGEIADRAMLLPEKSEEEKLLNGPALGTQARSQDAIDRLFENAD